MGSSEQLRIRMQKRGFSMTETTQATAPIIIEATVQEQKCPHLEITDKDVLCHATDWGRIREREIKYVKQIYGVLPHAMIIHCSGANHVTCSMYQKHQKYEAWLGE